MHWMASSVNLGCLLGIDVFGEEEMRLWVQSPRKARGT